MAEHLRAHGASFYDEIVDGTGLLRTQVEDALAELVALGLATSDSFAGLARAADAVGEAQAVRRRAAPPARALFGIEDAGRWALRQRGPSPVDVRRRAHDHGARRGNRSSTSSHALLRRYGVIFWRMLQREAAWLPPWRELLRVLRRLEARGDIRGGRFVAGVSGEQFALPEAVESLRDTRRAPPTGRMRRRSAAPIR